MRVFFDTSVLIPALVDQLSNHRSSFALFSSFIHSNEHEVYCSTHTLAETYAVLTSLPLPKRISSVEARMLIEESILKKLQVIELGKKEYLNALKTVSRRGLTSDIIYDALHVEAALRASCSRIYTYNIDHFEALVPEEITVSSP